MFLERPVVELVYKFEEKSTVSVWKGESTTKWHSNCFGVAYIIGWAKRAPHWGFQSRFRVIYMCRSVGMSVVSKMRGRDYMAHTHAQSHFWVVKTYLWHPCYWFRLCARAALPWMKKKRSLRNGKLKANRDSKIRKQKTTRNSSWPLSKFEARWRQWVWEKPKTGEGGH